MRTVGCETTLVASRERVWEVLTDFAAYPEWNPFLPRVQAEAHVGSPFRAVGRLPTGMSIAFTGQIEEAEPERRLAWRARPTLLPARLLKVVHVFELDNIAPDQVRLAQHEDVTGHLVPITGWMLRQVLIGQQRRMSRGSWNLGGDPR
jgi:hypothetical protein